MEIAITGVRFLLHWMLMVHSGILVVHLKQVIPFQETGMSAPEPEYLVPSRYQNSGKVNLIFAYLYL